MEFKITVDDQEFIANLESFNKKLNITTFWQKMNRNKFKKSNS